MCKYLIVLISVILIAGCDAGRKHFEGSWRNIKSPADKVVITKSQEGYVVEIGYSENGIAKTNKFNAAISNNADTLNFSSENVTGSLIFDATSGHILSGGGAEFEKIK